MKTKTPRTNKKAEKSIAFMAVAEFERKHDTFLQTENKNMKLTEYFARQGFLEFSRLLSI